MMEQDVVDLNIFESAVSIKDRYKPTDVIFMHLFNISKLSDHVLTTVDDGRNQNIYNYKNMIDILWTFLSGSIDMTAEEELTKLTSEYKGKQSDKDIVEYSTKKLGIFIGLLSRCGMWLIKEISDEI